MFKLNPGRPAVVETTTGVLQAAEAPTVEVTLGITEALILAALQGASTGCGVGSTLHSNLWEHPQYEAARDAVKKAVAFDGDDRIIYLHVVQAQINAIKAAAEEVQ